MGMQNPQVQQFEETDKLSDHYPEGTPFKLLAARVVNAKTSFGPGEMVIVRVEGHAKELGVWGAYLVAQVKSLVPDDLNRHYIIQRRIVEGFGKQRGGVHNPVKAFTPADPPAPPAQQLGDADPRIAAS